MHVLFVSACEKRALKRTRAVLDSYAIRTGESAWASPMTEEGLREVRAALKRSATRQTAVACYRNDGRMRMKLLWIVGSRNAFGPDGHFPVGATTIRPGAAVPDWVRVVSLLAQGGGWCHDLGKASVPFQRKLERNSTETDPVRHEWMSMKLLHAVRDDGLDWEAAWKKAAVNHRWLQAPPFEQGLQTARDALDYLVVTHHRLLGPVNTNQRRAMPDHSRHFSGTARDLATLAPKAPLPAKPVDAALSLLERVDKLAPDKPPAYWHAAATIARAGLILADHVVSARSKPAEAPLYANTTKTGELNQALDWHLSEVAHVAGEAAFRIASLRLTGLSEESVETICRSADDDSPFAWQNRAADALAAFRARSESPMLVFNMASTGSGKTRMNARAACLIGKAEIRFAVALNLRTLTLQTGDAFRDQVGIGQDEMACIIGDKVTLALHESRRVEEEDTDGNRPEADFDTSSDDFAIPDWLEEFAQRKPYFRAVVGAPLLVSTVDFLIAAGMPHRQGHHLAALLRFADSDLVLDEVDGYDPKPLVAILRLVQLAALFGRNVICSTATLAEPVASAIHAAYRNGAEMRGTLDNSAPAFAVAFIDDHAPPSIAEAGAAADFGGAYRNHLDRLKPAFGRHRERIPYLQTIADRSVAAWRNAVRAAVERLHRSHAWTHLGTGKRISFGLVRMANIAPAIETARFLADTLPHARIACYHAADLTIQRFLKEKTLDRLLTRKSGNETLQRDTDLADWLARAEGDDVTFIVVATPVEEIGRDHDFDWAVIEPSSTRSIVQTAGRVNRHRRQPVYEPNVAILQFNFRWARGDMTVFCQPGFESADLRYDSHDLSELLDWNRLPNLDAGLMFTTHRFARLDNRNVDEVLKYPLHHFFGPRSHGAQWIGQAIYDEYPLRDEQYRLEIHWDRDEDGEDLFWFLVPLTKTEQRWVNHSGQVRTLPRAPNDWLVWSPAELLDASSAAGIAPEQGLRVSMQGHDLENLLRGEYIFDKSFGFRRSSSLL